MPNNYTKSGALITLKYVSNITSKKVRHGSIITKHIINCDTSVRRCELLIFPLHSQSA